MGPVTFTPAGDGTVLAEFTPDETEAIATLAAQVKALLVGRSESGGDPAIERLLPNAYPEDPDAAAEFRRFTEAGLAERKIRGAEAVIASLGRGDTLQLDPTATIAWLRTLTDIRLVLAARLGIAADGDRGDDSSEQAIAMRDVYDWLGYLQESLVQAVSH